MQALSASLFHKGFTPALPVARALLPLLPPPQSKRGPSSRCPSRRLQGWWQKSRLRGGKRRKAGAPEAAGQAPWEADYELLPCEGLFEEYLEMGRSR